MLMFTKMWADGLARVADELQVVGIGPGSAGARHARPAVRVVRNDQALRARGTRRPAQQGTVKILSQIDLAVSGPVLF